MSASHDRDFLPTASLPTLQRRAELLRVVRRFFDENGYWEVETPILSRDIVIDAHLEPFVTEDFDGSPLYLQTSPEFAMKRLLAAGATAIYQITRAFRREEVGPLHNPEFTMLEWYRVGDTHREQMAFTERLVRHVMSKAEGGKRKAERGSPDCVDQTSTINPLTPSLHSPTSDLRPPPSAFRLPPSAFRRLTYDEAFERYLGIRVLGLSAAELRELAISRGIGFPASLTADDRDEWLNLLLVECVEPELRAAGPTFLYDFPASQAALAVVRDEQPAALDGCAAAAPSRAAVAERFELYVGGVELCNGYHELTDANELRRRIAVQSTIRARNNRQALPAASRLLDAMQHGLPPCSGVALGLDRLALLALGGRTLADVTAFPIDRA